MKYQHKVISCCLIMIVLLSCFASCAPKHESQTGISKEYTETPSTDQSEVNSNDLPYTFDTEQPNEIELSAFSRLSEAFGGPDVRVEYDLGHSAGVLPFDQLPIYQTNSSVYVQNRTDSELKTANDNFDKWIACFDNSVSLDSEKETGALVRKTVNGVEVSSRVFDIFALRVPMLSAKKVDWFSPSEEDILYEVEHNEFVKAACKYQEISNPDIAMVTTVFSQEGEAAIYSWEARIWQKSEDKFEEILNRSFRSVTLHGEIKPEQDTEKFFVLMIQTGKASIVEESVPVISPEDAFEQVLKGKQAKTGALFAGGGEPQLTRENCVAVRMSYRFDVVPNGHISGIYIPCYEFYFNCVENTAEKPSQTMLVLPACNLYAKPAE